MSELYFAYGSNLWIDQLVERIGLVSQGAGRPRVARLPNYRLTFNMLWDDGQVFANLTSPGTGVFGVVYSCSEESLLIMDAYEKGYERRNVRVVLENGDELNATTYFAEAVYVANSSEPRAEYLQKILAGAKHHGLPDAYIREIEATAKLTIKSPAR